MLIVLTTTPTADQGALLAEAILASRLAACVQVSAPVVSFYVWQGAMHKEPEYQLLIKTMPEKWEELRDFIAENHPYEVPEIIGFETSLVSQPYLDWMRQTVCPRIRNK